MRDTSTTSNNDLTWFLRSLSDHDTHRGELRDDGSVLAHCGASFTPRPTLKVIGPPPGTLATGQLALRGSPPDPDQICPQCQHSKENP
jgi:hypothetical protein